VYERVVVSPEVVAIIGREAVEEWLRIIQSRTIACASCGEMLRPTSTDQVTVSLVFFLPVGDGLPPMEVVVAHEGCLRSGVAEIDVPWSERSSQPEPPPGVALLRSSGTRAALLWETSMTLLGIPLVGGDPVNKYVQSCLGAGLHLVTVPFGEFEAPSVGWLFAIGSRRQGVRGGTWHSDGDLRRSAVLAPVGRRRRRAATLSFADWHRGDRPRDDRLGQPAGATGGLRQDRGSTPRRAARGRRRRSLRGRFGTTACSCRAYLGSRPARSNCNNSWA
jgi:hypothetical protein